MATTKTEFTETDNGGGSGERLQRPRVWEDLMNLPEESGSWECHAEEYLLLHCGHLRRLRMVIVTVARALDKGGSGSHARQLTTWHRVYGLLEAAANDRRHDLAGGWPELGLSSDCPFPTLDQMPIRHLSWPRQSSLGTRKWPRSRQQKASSSRSPSRRRSRSRTSTLSTTTTARKSKFALQ